MIAIAAHIIFGITLLLAMQSEVQAPEQVPNQVQVESLNDKNLQ